MDEKRLRAALRDLPLGKLRYEPVTGSTNDLALAWAAEGAPHLSLVLADAQTAGRGRSGRAWFSPPGASLALSLILRPALLPQDRTALYAGLGALALTDALRPFPARIKWPNDVLLAGRKAAGVLVESVWLGEVVESVILGIGVNVAPASVPPPDQVSFPATCLEDELGRPVDRLQLLHDLVRALLEWYPQVGSESFRSAWEERLAYRGETVRIWSEDTPLLTGTLLGLDVDGALRLRGPDGEPLTAHFGEIRLRPVAV